MKLDEIKDFFRKSMQYNRDELDVEIIRIPDKIIDWLSIWEEETARLNKQEQERKKFFLLKKEYYLGNAPAEIYKDKPKDRKIIPQGVREWVEADPEYQLLIQKIEIQNIKLRIINDAIDLLKRRGYDIKNMIEILKFKNGA